MSCYTLPSGFQLSWPPSCYLEQTTPFVVSEDELALGHTCVRYRSIPHRQYCLPVLAHVEPRHSDMIDVSEAPQPAGWPFSDHSMHHRAHLPDSDEENGQDNDGRSGQPQGFYMHCPLRSLIIGREAKASQKFLSYVALPHKTFNGLLPCALTKPCTTTTPAILRETSRQTSYQMVRWVFRPYAQLRRTICTSVLRPASTTLSHGLTVTGYSSPPFGSRRRVLTLKTMFEKN